MEKYKKGKTQSARPAGQNKKSQNTTHNKQADPEKKEGQRIAKYMAHAGLCSRRDAERWILEGRVKINGDVIDTPATLVNKGDSIEVDGKSVTTREVTQLFVFYKPEGTVTTEKDEKGRKTVFDALPPGLPRLVSVGRLDMNTEGLLLLTTDGGLSRYLELPKTAMERTYRVRAHGKITQEKLDTLKNGITHDGVRYGAINAQLEKQQGANVWLTMTLTEGKNREVRNVMEALGLQVNRLIRTSYGPFALGQMKKGDALEVPLNVLKRKLPDYFGKSPAKKGR